MADIALIETKPTRNDYGRLFDNEFEFDRFSLTSDATLSKVLKKDVDLEFDPDAYKWVILIGSEPLKFYTKVTQVMQYSGTIVDDKFLPTINPAMLQFKPEAKKTWEDAKTNIIGYISGTKKKAEINSDKFKGINDTKEAIEYIQRCIDSPYDFIGIDSETSGLYPRNGYILGISLSYEPDVGAYINADCLDENAEIKLQELFDKKRMVFHNAKFDIPMFEYHFNVTISHFEDTMLMHYMLDENPGTHGLKMLAMKYTDYGDYEKPMYEWMDAYRKERGVLKEQFKWEWIPFDVMKDYAAIDACVTFLLFAKFEKALKKGNPRLLRVYKNILLPACRFLIAAQDNGVPFSIERLKAGQNLMLDQIQEAVTKLRAHSSINQFEIQEGKEFNPNSVLQLRKLLFDYVGLQPTGITTQKGENSTNAEVLGILAKEHEIPQLILDLRKKTKIKNTYIDKIIPQLDRDGRLRTNFNLHGTTSGRLSSSGKMNMQQIPRDDPIIKGCIHAAPGHKIVAMDLTTAEVYVAAVLADDLELQDVFRSGGNFHSTIAHKVFRLQCEVDQVAENFTAFRQAAKAVTFGIMYGAGPKKIAEQVTKDGGSMSVDEAKQVIKEYFSTFWKLEEWLGVQKSIILKSASLYSHFGRKRRLPDAHSDNRGVQGHAVRSGLNFLVQSVASDINLIGATEAHSRIVHKGMKSKIFALVHDSVLAEVPMNEIEEYSSILREEIQKDRGIYISGAPVGCDFEIGNDYSMGKFDKTYGSLFNL
ncbi:MAG TPA: DNA polymerase [Saprospirales bacterium]|nr:DNA polymerase [Saprospirales bacterium]